MEMTQQDKAKLIRFLNFVCTLEASKPVEEMNEELIDACVTVLLDLQDKHVELSPEYIDNQVRKIFHPEDAETAEPETVKEPKKVVSKKKIWLVAACIAILVALLSIVSFSSERTVVDVLEDFFGTYEFIPFGKEVDVGEETYKKHSETRRYYSIQEFIKSERTSIMFPIKSKMSTTLKIISIFDSANNNIIISFDDSSISINIRTNTNLSESIINASNEKIIVDNNTFYLCSMDDTSQIQAYFIHNRNLYTVTCPNRDLLIDILENMEEVRYED